MAPRHLINGIYPPDYFTREGVDQIKYPNQFWWSSKQRWARTLDNRNYNANGFQTAEYLEIDLGRVREINYLNFSLLRAPIRISVEYDAVSDFNGQHIWLGVTPLPGEPFDDSIAYAATNRAAYIDAHFYFTDTIGKVINTRYLRIAFHRKDVEWPHKGAAPFRWPIIAKSLRTARFTRSYLDTRGVVLDNGSVTVNDDLSNLIPLTSDQEWTAQQFGLPTDFIRGDASDDNRITPNLMGFSLLLFVEPDVPNVNPATDIQFRWDFRDVTNPASPEILLSATQTGVVNDGRVWANVYFPEDQPIPGDPAKIYEIRVRTLSPLSLSSWVRRDNNATLAIPGNATFTNVGPGPASAANSDRIVVDGDVRNLVRVGDVVTRLDRASGFVTPVASLDYNVTNANKTTIFLTNRWQGPSGVSQVALVLPTLTYHENGSSTIDHNHSMCIRVYGDVADTGRDVLGNFYRYGTRIDQAQNVIAHNNLSWVCAPQPSPQAVESLFFDVRDDDGNLSVVDAVRVQVATPGVEMHIYYTDNHSKSNTPSSRIQWDQLIWKPIHATYSLSGQQTFTLPTAIRAAFIKLEFSHLQPRPLALPTRPELPAVTFNRYPTWIEMQFANKDVRRAVNDFFLENKRLVNIDVLKSIKDPILEFQYKERELLAALATNHKIKLQSVNQRLINTKTNSFLDPTTLSSISVSTNKMYGTPLQLNINRNSLLGQMIASKQDARSRTALREGNFEVSRASVPQVSTSTNRISETFSELASTSMWFNRECRHVYKIDSAHFSKKAYYVGINAVTFLRKDYSIARDDDIIIDNLWDDNNLDSNTWNRSGDSRLSEMIGAKYSTELFTRVDDNLPPISLLVTYTVDGVTYTDEPVPFIFVTQGQILQNSGLSGAINIRIFLNDGNDNHSTEFIVGSDVDVHYQQQVDGTIANVISPDVLANRLTVGSGRTDSQDADVVTGVAIIGG